MPRNTGAHSSKHYHSAKPINITYSESGCVVFGIQHATRMRHIVVCGLPNTIQHFFSSSDQRHDFRRKVTEKKKSFFFFLIYSAEHASQSVHGSATYKCDDTRDYNTICPPDDEHMCSKHVEA